MAVMAELLLDQVGDVMSLRAWVGMVSFVGMNV